MAERIFIKRGREGGREGGGLTVWVEGYKLLFFFGGGLGLGLFLLAFVCVDVRSFWGWDL